MCDIQRQIDELRRRMEELERRQVMTPNVVPSPYPFPLVPGYHPDPFRPWSPTESPGLPDPRYTITC